MVRRTVHVPDDLDKRVRDHGSVDDSYSGIVQQALDEYLERHSRDGSPKDTAEGAQATN